MAASRRCALRYAAGLLACGVAGALPLAGLAQPAADNGPAPTGYRDIPPQPVPAGDVIELVEFFWYGCPHCARFQPYFVPWVQRQPADVQLRRVPAAFRPSWMPHARLYYALEALGALERYHERVYHAYHVENVPLDSAADIADWAEQQGMNRERWLAAYASEDVDRKLADDREALRRYTVTGTPSIVVDGRYLTSSGMTPGVAAMIPVLDRLVAMAREQRARR